MNNENMLHSIYMAHHGGPVLREMSSYSPYQNIKTYILTSSAQYI